MSSKSKGNFGLFVKELKSQESQWNSNLDKITKVMGGAGRK
jgi:hypothetical protein